MSVCGSGHPGQKPVLVPVHWPLEGRGRTWFTLYPSLGPGVQELSAGVYHGSDSGPHARIWWEAPGCQKLAQNCHEEKPYGSFLLVFPDIFSFVCLPSLGPMLRTVRVLSPCRGRLSSQGAPQPHCVTQGGPASPSPGGGSLLSPARQAQLFQFRLPKRQAERVHAWGCFAFLANAQDSERRAWLASLHDVPKRKPEIQGGTLAVP